MVDGVCAFLIFLVDGVSAFLNFWVDGVSALCSSISIELWCKMAIISSFLQENSREN